MHTYLRGVRFIAFVLYGFLDSRAECLFVNILRRLAMAAYYLLANLNPNQPLRLARVP
jgi:hypothetical protein